MGWLLGAGVLFTLFHLSFSTTIRLRKQLRATSPDAAVPNLPHHQQFYKDIRTELQKLTSTVRLNQPIDSNSSYLKDFTNRAVRMNRGMNKARLNILTHKKELDHLLEQDLNAIQADNDRATEKSKLHLENVTKATTQHVEEVEDHSGATEKQAQVNTTLLRERKQELETLLPAAKLSVPDLRQKVRAAVLAYDVNVRHLHFQQHEVQKMQQVSRVATKYAKGFVNPPNEALALSRDIARTGLNAMKAPAKMARLATINMLENELMVLANLRSALAKDETIMSRGMTLEQVVAQMHAMLELELPSLKFEKNSRLTMFHECAGRGGSTLTSGPSACKELLVLHTPALFQKHLNAAIQREAQRTGRRSLSGLVSFESGPEMLVVEDEKTLSIDKNELMKKASGATDGANVLRFISTRHKANGDEPVEDATATVQKMLSQADVENNEKLEQEDEKKKEMKEDQELIHSIASSDNTKREAAGSVMSELAKVADLLKKEDPEGEKAAEEEDEKMKNLSDLEKAQQLMSDAKANVKTTQVADVP
jgi:hypothetical protein